MKGRKSIAWVLVCCVLLCLLNVCGATDDVKTVENPELLLMEPLDVAEPLVEEIAEGETDQPQPEEDMGVSQDEPMAVNDEREQDATVDFNEDQMEASGDESDSEEPGEESSKESDEKLKPAQSPEAEIDQVNRLTGGGPEHAKSSPPSKETEDAHESEIPAKRENDLANGEDGQTSADLAMENENPSAKNGEAKPVNPGADPLKQGGIVTSESYLNQSDIKMAMKDSLDDEDSSVDENLSQEEKSDPESVPVKQRGESDEEAETGMAGSYTEETLIQMGCKKALIQAENGAELFEQPSEEAEQTGRIEKGQEVWVLQTTDETWAEVHLAGRMAPEGYVRWEDLLIIQEEHGRGKEEADKQETVAEQAQEITPEEVHRGIAIEEASDEFTENESTVISDPDRPPRQVIVTSSLESKNRLSLGDAIVLRAELINFDEDDVYTCQWQYSRDGETFFDVPGANELTYAYRINEDNLNYVWGIRIDVDE